MVKNLFENKSFAAEMRKDKALQHFLRTPVLMVKEMKAVNTTTVLVGRFKNRFTQGSCILIKLEAPLCSQGRTESSSGLE